MSPVLHHLYKAGIIKPAGLGNLAVALWRSGSNLMSLLQFAAAQYPGAVAIADEQEEVTYAALRAQAMRLATVLHNEYQLQGGACIGIMCRNHAALVRAIFAASQCGASIYLLNAGMGPAQFSEVTGKHDFHLLIHDPEEAEMIAASSFSGFTLPAYKYQPSVNSIAKSEGQPPVWKKRVTGGRIIVLSSGTTGHFKTAGRKPAVLTFLRPFCTLLTKLRLAPGQVVYIANPVYHGFGLAAVLMSVALGAKMLLTTRFDTAVAAGLIQQHRADVVTLVPAMLQRLLAHDSAALASLSCIVSGGDTLSPTLAAGAISSLGPRLFNLYGTSEAGVVMLATPACLQYAIGTIGRKMPGVSVKILAADNIDAASGRTGRICIKCSWAAGGRDSGWIETGDLGYRDGKGFYFLQGRTDDMIVSGGENVYPIELEHILLQHPHIASAAVVGISDNTFGKRLRAFIVPVDGHIVDERELLQWLQPRAARHQMPESIIVLDELPYTAIGKPDKRLLAELVVS